ncbi:hypothetical protein BGZ94_006165 [Podila epigama]|nr:hypothetical protein BGZ94_006165 [Podila epigama]
MASSPATIEHSTPPPPPPSIAITDSLSSIATTSSSPVTTSSAHQQQQQQQLQQPQQQRQQQRQRQQQQQPQQQRQQQQQYYNQTLLLLRPWWRPPSRNFRPHPANRVLSTAFTPNPILIPVGPRESLSRYWYRALEYILRIPFREMIGNAARPYDPSVPQPLADIPMSIPPPARPPTMHDNNNDPEQGRIGVGTVSGTDPIATATGTETVSRTGTRTGASSTLPPATQLQGQQQEQIEANTHGSNGPLSRQGHRQQRRHPYLPQLRNAWAERTADMNMALLAGFTTTIIVTILAIVALALDWSADCTYLKVYLFVFVVRKWIMSFLMMDRALYRLPLNLVECDPDIDEERHNGMAIYMSDLFTWHGYAMLFAGSFYVYTYAISHYLGPAPVMTGVAIVFASMGLVPFFALLTIIVLALTILYIFYVCIVLCMWPFEKCGLSRRRAISRRNGGYRSNGTTNTTDLAQLERGGSRLSSIIGFGSMGIVKPTPAMAALPIVIYREPVIVTTLEKDKESTTEQSEEKNVSEAKAQLPQNPTDDNEHADLDTIIIINKTNDPGQSTVSSIRPHQDGNSSGRGGGASSGGGEVDVITAAEERIPAAPSKAKSIGTTESPVEEVEQHPEMWGPLFDAECAICLSDFHDGDVLRQMLCDHYFHRNCVDRWLVKNPFCPKCKRPI